MTPQAIRQLQASLGIPQTGVFDNATSTAMSSAVAKSISSNPSVKAYAGSNDPTAILNAYTTGDWSGVTSLTGVPFTPDQQQAAVASAGQALAPAYQAQKANDTADVVDTLTKNNNQLADTEAAAASQFGKDKDALDQNAVDNGVLFSGSRVQKQNDLRTTYATKEAQAQRDAAASAATTARGYQYAYGNDAVPSISQYYQQPGPTTYDASVAHGKVTPGASLSAVYNPGAYNYQGTKPVAQQTAIQTRAAGLLANKANKLTLSGVGSKL